MPGHHRFDAEDPLGERIYNGVKAQILTEAYVAGQRLDLGLLADQFRASITPVRAALHRMCGEGLVEANPSEGFRLPHVTEPALRNLYDWNGRILLQAWPPMLRLHPASVASSSGAGDSLIFTPVLFRAIAELCPNPECAYAVRRLNDRLHRVRLAETELFENVASELASMQDHLQERRFKALLKSVRDYHRVRIRRAGEVVRLLYQPVG